MNRLFLLLFGMVPFVAHAQVPDYVPTEGLVGWFNMNGTILNEVDGSQGLTTGTEPTMDRNGISGSALAFSDNAFGVMNDVDFPTNEVTISAWIYESQSWSNGDGIEFICLGSASSTTWGTIAGPQRMKLNRGRGCSGSNQNNLTGENFQLNTWVHVAFVSQGIAMPTDVYINGEHLGQHMNYASGSCSSNNLYFGVDIFSAPEYIDGSLDDIGVWNRTLSAEEITALYNAQLLIPGCTESTACNYNEEANEDDGTCTYPPFGLADCEAGGALCGEGTIWDASLQACVGFNDCPSDLDGDGIVGVNDLLSLLSDFGTVCPPEVAEWTCGDPVSYHGYDYATVQIGEQCWFAENLRTEHYANGDVIPANLTDGEWSSATSGAITVYGEDAGCNADSPDGDACDPEWSLNEYGGLYNWYAVEDQRGLCPSGWHVPSDEDFIIIELELGMSESQADSSGWRGTDEGTVLKADFGWANNGNGSDIVGFTALPAGSRNSSGNFESAGNQSWWWSTTSALNNNNAFVRSLLYYQEKIQRYTSYPVNGFSVRCLKD